jgi:hypothetical protein
LFVVLLMKLYELFGLSEIVSVPVWVAPLVLVMLVALFIVVAVADRGTASQPAMHSSRRTLVIGSLWVVFLLLEEFIPLSSVGVQWIGICLILVVTASVTLDFLRTR